MSTIRTDTLTDRTGANSIAQSVVYSGTAKAWSNLNGTGTIAERDSYNISSYVDDNTGLYQFNYSSSLYDGNYAAISCCVSTNQGTTGGNGRAGCGTPNLNDDYSTTAIQLITKDTADANIDSSKVLLSVNGDLA